VNASTPLPVDATVEDCTLRSPLEIQSILREIAGQHALLTLHFDGGTQFIVTALLAVLPEAGEILLDCGADDTATRRLLAARQLVAVTFLDHIKVQFAAGPARPADFEGAPAFRLPLPASLLRLQRRNFYRVKVPLSRPVACRVPHPGRPDARLDLKVLDLSVGGLALLVSPHEFDREPGGTIDDCRIALPEQGDFTARLEVRNAELLADRGRHALKRLGCRFLDLPVQVAGRIQRYILQVERNGPRRP
jgi:c-di-GMP-binding flagellar brake protein YcgR